MILTCCTNMNQISFRRIYFYISQKTLTELVEEAGKIPRPGARESLLGRPAAMTVAVAVVLVLLFGVWPTPLLDLAQASATSLYETLMSGAHHALR